MKISQWLHLYPLVFFFLFWNFSVKMCLIFHIVENKASILCFFALTTRRGLFECVPTQVFKKASTLFQVQVPATAPVVPGDELWKGLQVESLKMTVFSGNQTNWLLGKVLALWLNPGSQVASFSVLCFVLFLCCASRCCNTPLLYECVRSPLSFRNVPAT